MNVWDILILALIAAALALAVRSRVRRKKAGRGSCCDSGKCAACPGCGMGSAGGNEKG